MRQQLALRDHSLVVNAPLRDLIMDAVTEEKCAGGHLAQILVEDQDLLPRLHHPHLLLAVALSVLPLAKSAVQIHTGVLIAESQVTVDAFRCKA
jgi:hypothetical protein